MKNRVLAKKICDGILSGKDALDVHRLIEKFTGTNKTFIKKKNNVFLVITDWDIDDEYGGSDITLIDSIMLLDEKQFIEMTKKTVRSIYDSETLETEGDLFDETNFDPHYSLTGRLYRLPFHQLITKLLKIK
jgi:hypothetical protein